jgi:GNAT superfamily N-acetyltransferase
VPGGRSGGVWQSAQVPASVVERISQFSDRFTRAQATDVIELPWGFAVLQREFPLSHFHNRAVVTASVSAPEILDAADRVLEGLAHRYVTVDDDALGAALGPELEAEGYEHATIATMVHSGAPVPPPAHEVREVSLEMLRPAIIREWRIILPDATEEQLAQLADRTALSSRGAELVLLAIYEHGVIAAHADLYLDSSAGIAQFEHLATHKDFRLRGYGTTLVRDALHRAREAGCDVSFLTADVGDWPLEWYCRLGYAEAGHSHHFDRLAKEVSSTLNSDA